MVQKAAEKTYAIKAMLRSIFTPFEEKRVSELYIGDLRRIRVNSDHGKRGNQKMHNFWPFDFIKGELWSLGKNMA